jgi:UDP-N-acetylmuramoyl-L-alanyl-D-glutamate--2,6-diaminopimelate ligase
MAARNTPPLPDVRSLAALLSGFAEVAPADERGVTGLALDSRLVVPGDLFFACAGHRTSGVAFIGDAIAAGAVAVVFDAADDAVARGAGAAVPLFAVERLAERLGPVAARFHREPSHDMVVIGITGTNGKTSCAHYLARALAAGGDRCGLIGTLGYGEPDALRPGLHTTPDALTLQAELARLRDAGVGHVAIEVSSHALEQHRTAGTLFAGAVFTNLSHDHLDYHADLAAYGLAKKKLFMMPGLRFAAINRDDPFGRELIASLVPDIRCVAYGLGDPAAGLDAQFHIDAADVVLSDTGLRLEIESSWGEGILEAPLLGSFNAENLLAVLSALLMMDIPFGESLERLSALRPVTGRMERFGGGQGRPLVIVDYAHTPDALTQALAAVRPHCAGSLWCVFGCGGNRDRSKRPLMGAAAARLADRVVLTSDNPRDEDPDAIIAAIRAGIDRSDSVEAIPDRTAAIRHAIGAAGSGDVVLVAGKGHEDYQIVGGRRLPYSDQAVVAAALEVARG